MENYNYKFYKSRIRIDNKKERIREQERWKNIFKRSARDIVTFGGQMGFIHFKIWIFLKLDL